MMWKCFPNVDTRVIIVIMLTESDRESFLDFRDSLTAVPMGFRITIRVDGFRFRRSVLTQFGLDHAKNLVAN